MAVDKAVGVKVDERTLTRRDTGKKAIVPVGGRALNKNSVSSVPL